MVAQQAMRLNEQVEHRVDSLSVGAVKPELAGRPNRGHAHEPISKKKQLLVNLETGVSLMTGSVLHTWWQTTLHTCKRDQSEQTQLRRDAGARAQREDGSCLARDHHSQARASGISCSDAAPSLCLGCRLWPPTPC